MLFFFTRQYILTTVFPLSSLSRSCLLPTHPNTCSYSLIKIKKTYKIKTIGSISSNSNKPVKGKANIRKRHTETKKNPLRQRYIYICIHRNTQNFIKLHNLKQYLCKGPVKLKKGWGEIEKIPHKVL